VVDLIACRTRTIYPSGPTNRGTSFPCENITKAPLFIHVRSRKL